MAGQAACLIFADGLDRLCLVSFTSYLRAWGVCFSTRMCGHFSGWGGGGGILNFLFLGVRDCMIK